MTLHREYYRASFDGEPTDYRTAILMRLCDRELQHNRNFPPMNCFQGSYQPPSDVSGTTHAGGGVLDIGWPGASISKHDEGMCFLRNQGFQAGWCRHPSTGFILHVHTIDVGNRRLSPDAQLQLHDYRQDGDGLWPLGGHDDPFRCRPNRVVGWDFDGWHSAEKISTDLQAGIHDANVEQRELRKRLEKSRESEHSKRDRLRKLQHERLSV